MVNILQNVRNHTNVPTIPSQIRKVYIFEHTKALLVVMYIQHGWLIVKQHIHVGKQRLLHLMKKVCFFLSVENQIEYTIFVNIKHNRSKPTFHFLKLNTKLKKIDPHVWLVNDCNFLRYILKLLKKKQHETFKQQYTAKVNQVVKK